MSELGYINRKNVGELKGRREKDYPGLGPLAPMVMAIRATHYQPSFGMEAAGLEKIVRSETESNNSGGGRERRRGSQRLL